MKERIVKSRKKDVQGPTLTRSGGLPGGKGEVREVPSPKCKKFTVLAPAATFPSERT